MLGELEVDLQSVGRQSRYRAWWVGTEFVGRRKPVVRF